MILFVHIPRTGGTTLNVLLQKEYPDLFSVKSWQQVIGYQKWYEEIWGKPIDILKKDCVIGHLDFYWINLLRNNLPIGNSLTYDVISLVRDPVDRLISHYNYWSSTEQRYKELVRNMTFAEFITRRDLFNRPLDNDQTRIFSGLSRSVENVDDEILRKAKDNLQKVKLVGLTERYDESIHRFAKIYGWRSTQYPWRNRSREIRCCREDLSTSMIMDIYKSQKYDVQLYEFIVRKYWS